MLEGYVWEEVNTLRVRQTATTWICLKEVALSLTFQNLAVAGAV